MVLSMDALQENAPCYKKLLYKYIALHLCHLLILTVPLCAADEKVKISVVFDK